MNLKKSLKSKRAQASLEYFILFAIIAVLTILSFVSSPVTILTKVQAALQGESGLFQRTAERLTQ